MSATRTSPRTIFLDAVENHAPDTWAQFLDTACGNDQSLRHEVQRLLDAHADGSRFMDLPAAPAPVGQASRLPYDLPGEAASQLEVTPLGTTIGRYKLVEQIGEGGMGIVYVAEQTEPIRRQVALKIIKPGLDTQQIIARFAAERQTLALMEHPNIARILDAGTTGPSTKSQASNNKQIQSRKSKAQNEESSAVSNIDSLILDIVCDLELGHCDFAAGRPYFVMELVRGQPITDYCAQAHLTVRQKLELFITVCHAVQHAHQKGIIHRDLKPSNVLITLQDNYPIPKIIDFGVAKALTPLPLGEGGRRPSEGVSEFASEASCGAGVSPAMTSAAHPLHTGPALIGTPLYMSPEQADPSNHDIDTRSDVYSLGVLLYEILTSTTPFDQDRLKTASLSDLRRMIREDQPPPLSTRLAHTRRVGSAHHRGSPHVRPASSPAPSPQPRAPRLTELDHILSRSLAKDRTLRYQSASSLAADLRCFLDDLPIPSQPPNWFVKVRKWRRRNPAAAVGALTGCVLTLALIAGGLWHHHRITQALSVSDHLRHVGNEREALLRRELYTNDMRLAWQAISAGDVAAARPMLDRHEPQPEAADYTGFEWHYLRRLTRPPLRALTGHPDPLLTADVSPDNRWIASGDKGGEVRIWELGTGRLVTIFRYSDQEVTAVRFSPDGKTLATAGQDCTVRLWSVGDWRQFASLELHEMTVTAIAWSPDGQRLISVARDQMAHVWDVQGHCRLTSLPKHGDAIRTVAWSPDGAHVATVDGPRGLRLFATDTWSERGFLPCEDGINVTLALAFSPDGQLLVAGGYGGTLRVFDVQTLAELARGSGGATWSLTFWGPDRFVSGPATGGLMFWDYDRQRRTLTALREKTGGMQKVRRVVLADRGALIVTASEQDHALAVWDSQSLLGRRASSVSRAAGILPRREVALVDSGDEHLSVRRLDHSDEIGSLPCRQRICAPTVADDETLLAVADDDSEVCVYDTRDWKPQRRLSLPSQSTPSVANHHASPRIANIHFSEGGRSLAAGVAGGLSGYWNLQSGQWLQLKQTATDQPGLVQFSPAKNLLACSSVGTSGIEFWDLDKHQMIASFHVGDNLQVIGFNRDGSELMAGGSSGAISLWSVSTRTRLDTLTGHTGAVNHLAVSPDGRTLASAGADETVRLWSLTTRRELFTLCKDTSVHWLSFLADGSLALASGPDHNLSIFPGDSPSPASARQ